MEYVDRFDNKRLPLNKKAIRYNLPNGEYEQVTHLWIMNDNGEFLMQKRSLNKKVYPGKWSVTGGGVDYGERSIDGVRRECKEEIGLELDIEKTELMLSLKRKRVFLDVYLTRDNIDIGKLTLQKEEVDMVKWLDRKQIIRMIKNKEVADSISKYFNLFCELLDE